MAMWMELVYRFGATIYHLKLSHALDKDTVQIILDGNILADTAIPLLDDGHSHHVDIFAARVKD